MTETDLDALWLRVLEQVVDRSAHELKDSLNGVAVNLEVIRLRSGKANPDVEGISPFAAAAADQLEVLGARVEALLAVTRPAREPADVAVALKHLAALLVPATKADGGSLEIEGLGRSAPTSASAQATRLALGAGLLALTKNAGSSHCVLESGREPLVRFSHESAGAGSLDSAVVSALARNSIRNDRSNNDLILVFPGNP